jgi:endonuclease YncB( thermonuclease family)
MSDWVTDFLTDEFLSTAALFTPAGGQPKEIRTCFALGVEDVSLGGEIVPQGIVGQAGCRSSDIAGVKNGDTLEVGSVAYRVLKIQPDETGWTTLLLGKRYP